MAAKVKPVQPTEIKDKKIALQVIEEIRKPIPAHVYRRHKRIAKVVNEMIRRGIGTFMINSAESFAETCNSTYCACRFLTVDADIEHDPGVLAFYEKNGFNQNAELYNKNRKTISMRKDIYK